MAGVEMTLEYAGELRCVLQHGPSRERITTDAPVDNAGKGEAFSPTDLLGASLLSCAVTTMAIVGAREGIVLSKASGRVVKEMHAAPRRVAKLSVEITLDPALSEAHKQRLEEIARSCPVALSLATSVTVEMQFRSA